MIKNIVLQIESTCRLKAPIVFNDFIIESILKGIEIYFVCAFEFFSL
jgi:hypothetical protein